MPKQKLTAPLFRRAPPPTSGRIELWDIPSLAEQSEIVLHITKQITKLDCIIKNLTVSIEALKEHRTALTSSVVTGKIDVRNSITDQKKEAA